MRISVKEGDSGYNCWQALDRAVIYLDNKIMKNVVTADETLGYIIILKTNEFGSYEFDIDGNYVEEKICGRVRIEFDWN